MAAASMHAARALKCHAAVGGWKCSVDKPDAHREEAAMVHGLSMLARSTLHEETASPTLDATQHASSSSSAAGFALVIVVGREDATEVHELHEGAVLRIGRAAPAEVRSIDSSLSRMHAELRREGDVVHVRDLGSRNGSWVGGQRVERAELRVGDVAVFGSMAVSIQLRPSCEPAVLGVLGSARVLQVLAEECARCRVLQRSLSILLLRALRPNDVSITELVARCTAVSSPLDRIGLYDREVLLVVCPESDSAQATRKAERIAAAASGKVGCGIASLPDCGVTVDQLVTAASRALATSAAARREIVAPALPAMRDAEAGPIVRRSEAMRTLDLLVQRIAPKRIPVLVLGETGTGKELIARELHERSGRRGPLRVVNSAAIPESLIESTLFGHVRGAFTGAERDQPGVFVQAHRGTLFIDEVGELSAAAQAALLRTLDTSRLCAVGSQQEVSVDVRVVAATHRDLAAMTERGTFRLDLFHRLNAMVLQVPPLRDRREEIPALAELFWRQLGSSEAPKPRFSREALERMLAYDWPGNVRELRNVIERALAISDGEEIGVEDLPAHVGAAPRQERTIALAAPPLTAAPIQTDQTIDLRSSVRAHEASVINEALRRAHGNRRRAALLLQVPLRTFERKMKMLGSLIQRPR